MIPGFARTTYPFRDDRIQLLFEVRRLVFLHAFPLLCAALQSDEQTVAHIQDDILQLRPCSKFLPTFVELAL
jgi:hypothetical protein